MGGVPSVVAIVLLLVLALVVACGLVIHSLAMMLLRPPRMTDGKALYILRRMSPGDIGLPFEPLEFTSRTAAGKPIRIAAWWIATAAAADRTCILIHGFGDAKVGALAWAPVWRSLGWNLLLVDLRAHGESEGVHCTGGHFEREDLDAVIDALRARRPQATKRIALFGVSLGGAVALATAARRDDLDAVIADATFADYRRAAMVHGRLIGAPLVHLTPLAIRWAERIAAARFDDVRPLDTIRASRCPVMLIHGDADPFVLDDDVIAMTTSLRTRGEERDVHVIVPGAGHCMAIVADPKAYEERLGAFLHGAIR
jgi:pimeloyl-ACP methyl ester carboxylesterase